MKRQTSILIGVTKWWKTMIKLGNEEFDNVKAICDKYNLGRTHVIRTLLKYGDFSNPKIVEDFVKKPFKKPVTINGVTYDSVEDAAHSHKITVANLRYNLAHYGYKTDLVFKIGQSYQSTILDEIHPLIINGIRFRDAYDFEDKTCLTKYQFLQNLRDFGDQTNKIYLMRNNLSRKKYQLDTQIFRSRAQAKQVYGIRDNDFNLAHKIYGDTPDVVIKKLDGSYRFCDTYLLKKYMPFYLHDKFDQFVEDLRQDTHVDEYLRIDLPEHKDDAEVIYIRMDKVWNFYDKQNLFK